MLKLICLLFLMFPVSVYAQFEGIDDILGPSSSSSAPQNPFPQTDKSVAATKLKRPSSKPALQTYGILSAVFWQENVRASRAGDYADIRMQFEGLQLDYGFILPHGEATAWRKLLSANVGLGSLRGKANAPSIQDEFRDQQWVSLGLSPEIHYITTSHSSVGLALPLMYRLTTWNVKDDSGIKLDKGNSFSTGVAGVFNLNLTEKLAVRVSLTLQNAWEAAQWRVGCSLNL